ncbi:ATP-binding cassette domain-containing protein [bacterium]|nr:ATP-binding cassette domain-containing protein [bacterium]
MPSDPIFQFSNVSLKIDAVSILKGLNFEVHKGEFLSVLGASGAGKSSLLRMFNALSSPTEGSIKFRGMNIEDDMEVLRKNVGILFQNPAVFSGSVKDNLLLAGRWDQNIAQTLDHELIRSLKQVGLNKIELQNKARDLSGGEQQRLALARTLLNHPQVLLLDEPTSNLDPKLSSSIMDLVNNLRENLSLTVVAVSHDHVLMRRYANRVIILSHGELIGEGSFESLDRDQVFEQAGLLDTEAADET